VEQSRNSEVQANGTESDAMNDLDSSVFQAPYQPNNSEVFNAWDLDLCESNCTLYKGSDQTPLFPQMSDNNSTITAENLTFSMCTESYRLCNTECQEAYIKLMEDWPGPDTTWPFSYTTSLSTCISGCNSVAVNDHALVSKAKHGPDKLEENGKFAFCNHKIDACVREYQVQYEVIIQDFQDKQDN
jgi:hypothetical protein